MVYMKGRSDMTEMFVQALYTEDMALLKSIVEGLKYVRLNHLKSMLVARGELGGFTAFEFACLQGNATLALMLIDTGKVDVNKKGQCGWTPLHAAAYSGDLRTVQVLINSCADCYVRDENNQLPVDLAKVQEVRHVLYKTMKAKNLAKFNQIVVTQQQEQTYTDGKPSTLQVTDNNNQSDHQQNNNNNQQHQRSKSCFANVSLIKMNELKTQFAERKQSSWEFYNNNNNTMSNNNFGQLFEHQMKRWKTCSDLTTMENVVFDMTC